MPNVIGNPPSLAAFFDAWRRNEGTFLRFEGDRGLVETTYAETASRAAAFAWRLRESGIGEDELKQARSKVLSRLVRGSERPKGRMTALGMNWTYQHQYRSVDDELRSFESVTLDDVRRVLERYPLDRVTTLALGPLAEVRKPGP